MEQVLFSCTVSKKSRAKQETPKGKGSQPKVPKLEDDFSWTKNIWKMPKRAKLSS